MLNTSQVLEYTNQRLQNWYENVKEEYGVIGDGTVSFNSKTNHFEFTYTENGVRGFFQVYNETQFYKIDTIFNIWAEEANIENDRIN